MSSGKLNMEELFSSQFEGYKVEPSPGMWSRIRTQLFWKEFFTFSLNSFNVYYSAVIAAAVIGGTVLIANLPDKQDTIIPDQEMEMPQQDVSSTEAEGDLPEKSGDEEVIQEQSTVVESKDDRAGKKADETTISETTEIKPDSPGQAIELHTEKDSEQQTTSRDRIKVSAGFTSSVYQGCAPLAVRFTNQSENAADYTWSFGDGGSSAEKDPSYVFDEPGEYTVQLKVVGLDEKEYIYKQKMNVFVTPRAQFEYDQDAALANGQPVNFYNYSKDADFYAWDFGDNERSTLSDPVHYYDSPGEYDITLKAWTANHCYDSTKVLNAFASSENNIVFPNAFTPNTSGPVGGYYTPGDPYNEVFHPIVTGEIMEYELTIYNRVGQVIFQTGDINFGWDGYYQDQLSGQGVYIWKARGRYANGKTFVKSGDVTLIRR